MIQLIKNVHILTMDPDFAEIKSGFVLVNGSKIVKIGEMSSSLPEADYCIDGQGGILMPGMVNTHTHVGMIPFRSLGDDTPDRLRRFLFPLEKACMTEKLVYASAKYAIAEMLLAGITSFCDMYYFEDRVAQAVDEMKGRALVGETIIDMPICDAQSSKEALSYAEKMVLKWHDHSLITPIIAPHATNTNTEETLRAVVDLSKRLDVPVTMHVAEMTYEIDFFKDKYHETPIEFLNKIGLLERQFIMAHCILTSHSDISLLADHRNSVSVAHCIGANTKSAKGVAPISEMLKKNLTVGLGTDGPSSGNTLDLLTQMKLFANFHKTVLQDRSAFPAKEIVALATIGGAKALGLDQLVGSIEVGKKADLTLIETKSVNMFPMFDAYSSLVYSANASNVEHVWVNGEHLVSDKELVNFELEELRDALKEQMKSFVKKAKELAIES